MSLSANAIIYAQTRGLTQATLESLPVASGTTTFPDLGGRSEALFFKYQQGWKARSFPEKSFVAGGGFKSSFWNIDSVLEANPSTVFVAEGEIDAASIAEIGIPACQVLSVPTGARLRASDAPLDQRGYGYVQDALKAGLSRIKRLVWCGDGDEPGLSLRADMVRLFGPARFMFATWPEGVKDANEMLIKHGGKALRTLIMDGAIPWPQEGLYRLDGLPEPPVLTLWTPNIEGFAGRVHVAPKTLSLVAGAPGMGKTLVWGQIWQGIVKEHDLVACIASFETRPKPHLRRQLRTLHSGKLEVEMIDFELRAADQWIKDHYLFVLHPEQRPDLDWFLEIAETAVIRHGAKVIQIDPWNRLEGMRGRDESETEYILRCLRAMYVFANDMDCHFQIVAHPAKMDGHRRGEPPTLEDVSGSRHWENIVDQGFVVHRPQMFEGTTRKTETAFYHRKARFEELGYPCKIMLNYDLSLRRYVPLTEPNFIPRPRVDKPSPE